MREPWERALDADELREWRKKAKLGRGEIIEILKKYEYTTLEALTVLEYVESSIEYEKNNAKLSQLI